MADYTEITKRSKDSASMLDYWEEVEIILRGEDAVKSAGEMFLSKLPGESDKQYQFRKSNAKLTNVYSDILGTLSSKPFEEEVKFAEGEGKSVPEELSDFAENVDGDGNSLTVAAREFFFNAINDAIAWLLIDYPNTPETVKTVADAKAAKIRPFWAIILAKNVLEVRTAFVGAERVITYARILEPNAKGDDIDCVRVFERIENAIHWTLYQVGDKTKAQTVEDTGILSIDVIPLVPLITGQREGKRFSFIPPLKSAMTLQKTLYRQESALEFAKIMTAFPMLSASGVKPERNEDGSVKSISVGPQTVLYAPPDGDGNVGSWTYVEPGANSLKFLAEDIKETKQDLRELGKQPLTAQAGLTVITTAYAAGKAKSAVKSWGLLLKDALENAMVITCKWLSVDANKYDPELSVYDDYDDLSEEDFVSVLGMRQKGDLSQETVWTEARRRGILSAEFDADAEKSRLLKEVPALPGEFENEENPDDEKTNDNPFGRKPDQRNGPGIQQRQ